MHLFILDPHQIYRKKYVDLSWLSGFGVLRAFDNSVITLVTQQHFFGLIYLGR